MDGPSALPSHGDTDSKSLYTLIMGLEGKLAGALIATSAAFYTTSGVNL